MGVANAILLDYLTSEVALEEPEIGCTDTNNPTDNNCTDDELRFGMPGGSDEYDNQCEEIDSSYATLTASRQWQARTEPERLDLWTIDVNRYEGNDGDHADADELDEATPANDGSTLNLYDWGNSARECEDWTVYFWPGKYDNGEANATASDVCEAKTALYYVTNPKVKHMWETAASDE